MQEDNQDDFKRELGLLDGIMLVVGSMIGSGIIKFKCRFKNPLSLF